MKSFVKNLAIAGLTVCALAVTPIKSNAQVQVAVDPGAPWVGYMNVWDIPQNSGPGQYPTDLGPFQFGSPWGVADLVATWAGPQLTLAPNTIGDPADYWYIGGGAPGNPGNKIMGANIYVEFPVDTVSGQTLSFSGTVLSDTLTLANNPGNVDGVGNGWTSVAFIKDFAPDYSSFVAVTVPLAPGPFNISYLTDPGAGRHVQYGFETLGPDVWITDVGPFGSIQVVPEPSSLALLGLGMVGALVWRRRQ